MTAPPFLVVAHGNWSGIVAAAPADDLSQASLIAGDTYNAYDCDIFAYDDESGEYLPIDNEPDDGP